MEYSAELIQETIGESEINTRSFLEHRLPPHTAAEIAESLEEVSTQGSDSKLLIAEGDSWFDQIIRYDLLSALEDEHDYQIEEVASPGHTIKHMAHDPAQLNGFLRIIKKALKGGQKPRAILLSGGGNDVAGAKFEEMLLDKNGSSGGYSPNIAESFIGEELLSAYTHIITRVSVTCREILGEDLPIIVHGYDYVVPDGRGVWSIMGFNGPLPGPWLGPTFSSKGYEDLEERQDIINELMNLFNEMLIELSNHPRFSSFTHFINLRNTLSFDPHQYQSWWADELHPNKEGFKLIADKFYQTISSLP